MTQWFDTDCRAARRRARAEERRYRRRLRRRRCSDADRQDWKAKLKEMRSVYEGKKVNCWKDEIATSQGDMRRLWRTLHSALGERTGGETGDHTANEFVTFFTNKVDSVRVHGHCHNAAVRRPVQDDSTAFRMVACNGRRSR